MHFAPAITAALLASSSAVLAAPGMFPRYPSNDSTMDCDVPSTATNATASFNSLSSVSFPSHSLTDFPPSPTPAISSSVPAFLSSILPPSIPTSIPSSGLYSAPASGLPPGTSRPSYGPSGPSYGPSGPASGPSGPPGPSGPSGPTSVPSFVPSSSPASGLISGPASGPTSVPSSGPASSSASSPFSGPSSGLVGSSSSPASGPTSVPSSGLSSGLSSASSSPPSVSIPPDSFPTSASLPSTFPSSTSSPPTTESSSSGPTGYSLTQELLLADSAIDRFGLLPNDAQFVFDFSQSRQGGENGGKIVTANRKTFPALVGTGSGMAVGRIGPCGIKWFQTHPQSTEIQLVVQGRLATEMMTENGVLDIHGKPRVIKNEIGPYQMTPFYPGFIHIQFNPDCTNVIFVSTLASDDFGTGQIPFELFSVTEDANGTSLGQIIAGENIEVVRKVIPSSVALGVERCLQQCGIDKRQAQTNPPPDN